MRTCSPGSRLFLRKCHVGLHSPDNPNPSPRDNVASAPRLHVASPARRLPRPPPRCCTSCSCSSQETNHLCSYPAACPSRFPSSRPPSGTATCPELLRRLADTRQSPPRVAVSARPSPHLYTPCMLRHYHIAPIYHRPCSRQRDRNASLAGLPHENTSGRGVDSEARAGNCGGL